MSLRKAQELTKERERKNKETEAEMEAMSYRLEMERAIRVIELAHKDRKNHAETYFLSESVIQELKNNGYRITRIPPEEFAAMGTVETISIDWD